MKLPRRTTWGCALLAVVGSAALGCGGAPETGPLRARYLALDPTGAPIGSCELFDAVPPAVGLREQIAIKSPLGPPVDVVGALDLESGSLRRFTTWRRARSGGDSILVVQTGGRTRWRLQQGLAVTERGWDRAFDGAVVDVTLPGIDPSTSLIAWQALLRDRSWRVGQSLALDVLDVQRGVPAQLALSAREQRVLTLGARQVDAVRLFAHLTGAGHTIWVEQTSGQLLAMDGVAGVRIALDGLQLPSPARLPQPASVIEQEVMLPTPVVTLAGTFSHPAAGSRWPALVLIHGSGPMDRDENAGGFFLDTFRTIAHRAGERGWAVMRYDKRGAGASQFTGEQHPSTLTDLAGDVRQWVEWLGQRSDVDHDCLVLAGHSEGGYLAPLVAVDDPRVAGVVLLAGPANRLDTILREQGQLIMRAHGADDAQIAAAGRQQAAMLRFVASGRERNQNAPGSELGLDWLRSHLQHDPAAVFQRLDVPLLAIYGAADLQVPATEAAALAAALPESQRSRSAIQIIPQLDHLLRVSGQGGDLGWYADPDRPLAPVAIDMLLQWLDGLACRQRE